MILMYIDPATGSMLFMLLVGIFSAVVYFLKGSFIKLKQLVFRGERSSADEAASLIIFGEDKRYWNTFRSVCDELERRGEDVIYLTSSEDDPVFAAGYSSVKGRFIGTGNRMYAHLNMMKAPVVLSTTPGLGVYQWKRSKGVDKYVFLPHNINDLLLYRMFGLDYYDSILLSGEYEEDQIRALEKLRDLPEKECRLVGLPYMDDIAARFAACSVQAKSGDRLTVLLAPSWGASSIFGRFGDKVLAELVKLPYNVIVRPHPQSFIAEKNMLADLMRRYPESDTLHWDSETDNFRSLSKADVLLSDFSGVLFEYAFVFGRPVIYVDTEFDPSVYDAWWLDADMLWTFKALDRFAVKLTDADMDRLPEILDNALHDGAKASQRDAVKDEAWANRGHAAESIADYLIELKTSQKKPAERSPMHKRRRRAAV